MLQDQLKPLMSYQQQIVAGGQFFDPHPLGQEDYVSAGKAL